MRIADWRATSFLLQLLLIAAGPAAAGDWPQLLGPARDGRYEGDPIRSDWAGTPPTVSWSQEIGAGFAGPVAVDGKVFVFHRMGKEAVLDALRIGDGSRIWRATYTSDYRDDFGFNDGPRAAPVVSGNRVVTFGAGGHLTVWDQANGKLLWQVDTHDLFGVRKGYFGAASSPLVSDGRVLLNVGGRDGAGVVAFDVESGNALWRTSDHEASYSSPTLVELADRQTAVFLTREGLLVLEPSTGTELLEYRWRARINASVNAATPIVVGDRIFLSSSYGVGAVLLEWNGGEPTEIWKSDRSLTNHYATAVLHKGFLYGFHGRQESGPALRCVRLDDGEVLWSEDRFGAGSMILAEDQLVILKESGELIVAPASPEGFSPTGTVRILEGETRAYPALAHGILLARDQNRLVAVDLRAKD